MNEDGYWLCHLDIVSPSIQESPYSLIFVDDINDLDTYVGVSDFRADLPRSLIGVYGRRTGSHRPCGHENVRRAA